MYSVKEDPQIAEKLSNANDKMSWWKIMSSYIESDVDTLDCEQAGPDWLAVTKYTDSPLCYLFKGEVGSHDIVDESADPDVGFICTATVKNLSIFLREHPRAYFEKLLQKQGAYAAGEIWIYEEMKNFFNACSSQNRAIFILLDWAR